MTMNPIGRMHRNTPQSLINDFFDQGGQVTQCSAGARTEEIEYTSGFYGRGRKKKEPVSAEESNESADDES